MAIVLPSAKIYNIDNQKIVDNQVNGVECKNNISFIEYIYEMADGTLPTIYSKGYYVRTEDISITHPTNIGISFKTYPTTYGDFLIGVFTSNAKYFDTSLLSIVSTAEPYISINYDLNGIDHDEFYVFDDMADFKSHISQYSQYNKIMGGVIGTTDNFNITQEYCFAVKKSIGDRFQVFYGCPAEIYRYNPSNAVIQYGSLGNSISISSNELMQNTTKHGTTQIAEYLATNIISSYGKGKETATIRCSVNDYYNEDNTIAKSITDTTKSMVFEIGDTVIPMIPTPNGDTAMSKKSDGTAKVFNVVGTDMIYDGAVWQTITVQEVTA